MPSIWTPRVAQNRLGAVLNDVDFESNRYYGMYGKYGYYQYNYRYQSMEPSGVVDIPVPFLPKS